MFYNLLNNVCAPLMSFFIRIGGLMNIPFSYNIEWSNSLYSSFVNPLNGQVIDVGTLAYYLDNFGIVGDIFYNVINFFVSITVRIFPFVNSSPTWLGFLFGGVIIGIIFALVGGIVRTIKALIP